VEDKERPMTTTQLVLTWIMIIVGVVILAYEIIQLILTGHSDAAWG
jgi:hypothetical protein